MRFLQKIIEYGLYLLVFLLPFQTRYFIREFYIGGWPYEYGNISIYATDILLLCLLFLFLIFLIRSNVKYQRLNSILGFIAILELSIFISIFISIDKWAAIYGYIRFLLGLGFFFLIIYAAYDRSKLIYGFVGGVFLQACLGIWQFLSQSSFSLKWLGMAVHNSGDLGTSIIETMNGERWLRAYGGLDHPNILGGVLVIAILFTVYLIGVYEEGYKLKEGKDINEVKTQKLKFKILKSCILYFVLCILFIALFFSFSRTAWTGLIIGLLTMLIGAVVMKGKSIIALLKIISIFFILGTIFSVIYSDLLLSRLSVDTRAEIMSVTERASMYDIAHRIIKDDWVFGTGINNYGVSVEQNIRQGAPYYFYQPVHNVFVLIWAEVGIIGLIAFICLIFNYIYLILQELRSKDHRNKENSIYDLSILISMSLMFLFDHWWWSLHYGVLLFWLMIALLVTERKDLYKKL